MGKFEKVLIASDFDGTLKNDDGIITDDVRSAIAYFISEGGYLRSAPAGHIRAFISMTRRISMRPFC